MLECYVHMYIGIEGICILFENYWAYAVCFFDWLLQPQMQIFFETGCKTTALLIENFAKALHKARRPFEKEKTGS